MHGRVQAICRRPEVVIRPPSISSRAKIRGGGGRLSGLASVVEGDFAADVGPEGVVAEPVARNARGDPDPMFVSGDVQTPLRAGVPRVEKGSPISRATAAVGRPGDGAARGGDVAVVGAGNALLARTEGRDAALLLRGGEAGGQKGGEDDEDGFRDHGDVFRRRWSGSRW